MARSAGNMEMPYKPISHLDPSSEDYNPFSYECGVWEAFCDVKLGNKIPSWLELLAMPPTPYNLGYRSALSDAKKCRRAALGQADPPKFLNGGDASFNAMAVYGNR